MFERQFLREYFVPGAAQPFLGRADVALLFGNSSVSGAVRAAAGKVSSLCLAVLHMPIPPFARARWHLRPIPPYTCTLLSSHYGMIAATATDLSSCMRESDRQNGQKVPHPTLRLRKLEVWISTSKSDLTKLIVLE
jgi:hypothetical protein